MCRLFALAGSSPGGSWTAVIRLASIAASIRRREDSFRGPLLDLRAPGSSELSRIDTRAFSAASSKKLVRVASSPRYAPPSLASPSSSARSASPPASSAGRCHGARTRSRRPDAADRPRGLRAAMRIGQHRPRWSASSDRAAAPAGSARRPPWRLHLLPRRSCDGRRGRFLLQLAWG